MKRPSIKGSVFAPVIADVQRLLAEGRVGPEELESRLAAEDLVYLEEKLNVAVWYPIEAYDRFARVIQDFEGGGRPEHMRRRGELAAQRLMESGLYAQLRKSDAMAEEVRRSDEGLLSEHHGRLMTSLAGAIYDFGHWEFRARAVRGEYRIDVTEAAAFPEVGRHATEGFIHEFMRRVSPKRAPTVTSQRLAPDHVRFTIRFV
jgi:hypothetical protein